MDKNPAVDENGRGITRRQLEAVIRRAAELYAAESDADERISEEELLRIGAELGLPPHLVRQALYEGPAATGKPTFWDRLCGPAHLSTSRVVPTESALAYQRLEEYLVTREYLQLTRRQPGRASFIPADDLLSRAIRSFSRPASRHSLSRAHAVELAVHPLEEGRAHVRVELNYAPQRKEKLLTGGVVGAVPVGLIAGGALASVADILAGHTLGTLGLFASFAGGVLASAGAGVAIAAAHFRRQKKIARHEVETLLDRVEAGERLDPPLPPWRRRLESRLLRLPPWR